MNGRTRDRLGTWALVLGLLVMAGCKDSGATTTTGGATTGGPRDLPTAKEKGGLALTSPALAAGKPAAPPYACVDYDHLGKSPPLSWSKGPEGTTGYAITVVDPDANEFVHWAVVGIPPDVTSLPEGASPGGSLPAGARELKNGYEQVGYGGPCPPQGAKLHHYVFKVWALSAPVTPSAADRSFFEALARSALATGSLTVDYQR